MGMRSWWASRGSGKAEQRDIGAEDVYGEDFAKAHLDVAGEKALRLIPVFAAIALVADSIAVLPIAVYRKLTTAREARPTPDWLRVPDRRITRYDWIFQALACLLLRGNAYGLVVRVNGRTDQILWIHPSHVFVDETGPTPWYYLHGDPQPHLATTMGGDLLHVRAFMLPGSVVGLSPIGLFRVQFETARAAMEYGHDWFENSAVPSGILKNENATLSPEQTAEAKRMWQRSVRKGEPVALDKHWSWTQVSLSASESQFLETIKATTGQIAAIFRVDPQDIGGEATNSMTYSTVEGNQRKYNIRTAMSWVVRLEEALRSVMALDGATEHDEAKFNLDALARPNTLERVKATSEELRNGTLTLPEARIREDRPPLTAAEIEQWQQWFATTKSQSESDATSTSVSTTQEGD